MAPAKAGEAVPLISVAVPTNPYVVDVGPMGVAVENPGVDVEE